MIKVLMQAINDETGKVVSEKEFETEKMCLIGIKSNGKGCDVETIECNFSRDDALRAFVHSDRLWPIVKMASVFGPLMRLSSELGQEEAEDTEEKKTEEKTDEKTGGTEDAE